ncbi:MAG: acylneuraminate cytidylyltransferase family protein, partial [Minisyncoccia bacterium]
MKVYAFILARGGSKAVPKKNIRPLMGKPLIVWTIEAALRTPEITRVFVSTEDPEIAEIARLHGAEVLVRPAELA